MSGADTGEFLAYWENEGARYLQRGDYAWMAGLLTARRVLEIGCGPGFSTQALLAGGREVLVLEALPECLAAMRARLGAAAPAALTAEIAALDAAQRQAIADFAPQAVVCWLMGAPAEVSGAAAGDGGAAVVAYRERIHRAVAELAAELPTVAALHFVDRTLISWQAKDLGRDTLAGYHAGKTLAGLPFAASRRNALYRRLDEQSPELERLRRSHPAMKDAVPVLASLLAERQ